MDDTKINGYKKLGTAGISIGALWKLFDYIPENQRIYVVVCMTAIAIAYLLTQGLIDKKKAENGVNYYPKPNERGGAGIE